MKHLMFFLLTFLLVFKISFAQGAISTTPHSELYSNTIIPICKGENPDPDGDGWGWENMFSCHVGASFEKLPTPTPIDASIVRCGSSIEDLKIAMLSVINETRATDQECGSTKMPKATVLKCTIHLQLLLLNIL